MAFHSKNCGGSRGGRVRTRRLHSWSAEVDGSLPEETTIGIDLGYATCVFAIPDDAPTDWKGVMTFGQAPQNSRGGLMLPLEGNRWMTTMVDATVTCRLATLRDF